MKTVTFSQIKDELINNFRRQMLIPVFGSGLTKGCNAYKGTVPSGEEYIDYMIGKIKKQMALSPAEVESLEHESLSAVSEIYHKLISSSERKEYIKSHFTKVHLEECKKKMLKCFWPYVYTLNIDDGIENNSDYNHVVYSNRPYEKGIFDDFRCVIKLHGDVSEMITYEDDKSEIFAQTQYLNSLEKNRPLLTKLQHDSIFQNLIFIGCSLKDEIDLLAYSSNREIDTAKYFCVIEEPTELEKIKYEKHGITHCIVFNSFDEIYESLYEAGVEAGKISVDNLDLYKPFSVTKLTDEYETNKPYLFFGKSLINKDHTISLPYFFISRDITKKVFENLSSTPLQFIMGTGCSGKSYILVDLARRIKTRDVFLFESKDRLTNQAFNDLVERKNCVIIADNTAFSENQIESVIINRKYFKNNNVSIVIAVDKNNRTINGILKLYDIQNIIKLEDIPRISIKNKLSDGENNKISRLLTAVAAGIFKKDETIVDNIIGLSKELSEKNKYHNIVPSFKTVPELAALIALAVETKIYSTRAVNLELYDELDLQCKYTDPLIGKELTWTFETSSEENAPIKYVINAEYWLCFQLEEYANNKGNWDFIVEAYKYIVTRIIAQEGKPNLLKGNINVSYRDYILFDNINRIFCSSKNSGVRGLTLIRKIYEGLNRLLSADPNYMHQRAKCYIKSACYEKEKNKKIECLDKAYRDANVAYQIFDKRYEECGNEKLLISMAHITYTKSLILCHKCFINGYSNIDENTTAVCMLYDALKSNYNSYEYAKKDTFNYSDVIAKMITNSISSESVVKKDVYDKLEELFIMISK